MRRVIDLECVLPPDENGVARQYFGAAGHRIGEGDPELLPPLAGYGFENYRNIFTRREGGARQPDAAKPAGKSLAEIVAEMDRDNVQTSVIHRMPNDLLAKIVQAYPTRFFGLATLSPFDGMRGVRELERLVREEKVQGMRVGALYNGLAASDRRYYPLYAKCVELDIPVRIYASMNYANDRPYDLGHPRHLDQVAIDFPELRIIAGLGGWPWINDMVGLLRRHPNLYLRHRLAPSALLRHRGLGLGDAAAVRQHAAAGQGDGRLFRRAVRPVDPGDGEAVRGAAAEGSRGGEVAVWQRQARPAARLMSATARRGAGGRRVR